MIKRLYIYSKWCILVWMLGLVSVVSAGEYAADFLKIGVGARPMAMGGAFTALANDATAFYWNPAGLATEKKIALHVDHVSLFEGLAQYNVASMSMALNRNMTIGLGWLRHGEDDIPRYGELSGTRLDRLTDPRLRSDGEPEGFFGNNENAILFTISRADYFDLYFNLGMTQYKIPMEFFIGFSGKYIMHNLDDKTGSGQGLDAGAILRFVSPRYIKGQAQSWLGLAFTAHDLSRTSISWNTASEHSDLVQTLWTAGVAASHLLAPLRTRFTVTADQEFGYYDDYHLGAEAEFFHTLAVRGGYRQDEFTAGAGLRFRGYNIDYAFVPHDLGTTHRISGTFRF